MKNRKDFSEKFNFNTITNSILNFEQSKKFYTLKVEVLLMIEEKDIRVEIALTKESLHRRNLSHFGPTTLKPTISHGLLWYAG